MEVSGITEKGSQRTRNQDAFLLGRSLAADTDGARLTLTADNFPWPLAVADGMGGHSFGERASRLALQALSRAFFPGPGPASAGEFRPFLDGLHQMLLDEGQSLASNLGTTLSGFLVSAPADRTILFFHVGDSAIWRRRGEAWKKLTQDHHEPGQPHLLTSCLGGGSPHLTRADLWTDTWAPGDLYLLVTDGILGLPPGRTDGADFLDSLLDKAREMGATDDLTAVMAVFP